MRYHSLDAWRGLACLLVVVFHSTHHIAEDSWLSFTRYWWAGVPMFFVISGYCISATADSSRRKGHRTSTYFARRLRRIFPPYLIFLAACVVIVGVVDVLLPGTFTSAGMARPWWLNGWNWLGNVTLTEGWRHYIVGTDNIYWFLGHAWTLGYEEQFYAVTGLILLVAPQRFFLAAALVSIAVLCATPYSHYFRGLFFDGYWLHFAAGILVYYAVNYAKRPWLCVVPLLAGAVLSASDPGSALSVESNWHSRGLIAFSFAALILALHRYDKAIVPWVKPLTFCGLMCYSLYLVHAPLCLVISTAAFKYGLRSDAATLAVTIPLCVVVSLLVAWPFHLFVERRFLNSPIQPSAPAPAPQLESSPARQSQTSSP